MSEFETYKTFGSESEFEPLTELFSINNIEFQILEDKDSVDITFAGNLKIQYLLKIKQEDFDRADKLLASSVVYDSVNDDHYLHDFSDAELIGIFEKFDEWSKSDLVLARTILERRGKTITDSEIENYRQKRIGELSAMEKVKPRWIFLGYISAITGGFLAILIGMSVYNTKKTLPDGRKVFCYDEKSRMHGRFILYSGIVMFIFYAIRYIVTR